MGASGQSKKTKYQKEFETLQKVELANFTRMQMTKKQRKHHLKMMQDANQDNLDRIDAFRDLENILNKRSQREKEAQEYNVANRHLTKIKTNFDKSMKSIKNKGGTDLNKKTNKR